MVAVIGRDPYRGNSGDLSQSKSPNLARHACHRRSWRRDCWEGRGRGRKLLVPRELGALGALGGRGAAGTRTIRKAQGGSGIDGVWAVDGVSGVRWLRRGANPQSIRLILWVSSLYLGQPGTPTRQDR